MKAIERKQKGKTFEEVGQICKHFRNTETHFFPGCSRCRRGPSLLKSSLIAGCNSRVDYLRQPVPGEMMPVPGHLMTGSQIGTRELPMWLKVHLWRPNVLLIVKFSPQPHQKYYVTHYGELGFSSLTRMKDDYTVYQIIICSLVHFSLKG